MKAWAYRRFGEIDVLATEALPDPVPAAGDVIVAPVAVGFNPIDNRVRRGEMGLIAGRHFPRVPGADVAGFVVALGDGVTDFSVGQRVFGATDAVRGGALAERVAVPARQLAALPVGLSDTEAAALPIAGSAALAALRDLGQVTADQRVLLHGATGGVGLFAIQLAKAMGTQVTAVCGTDGVALAQALGADRVIDYRARPAPPLGGPYDVIANLSGKLPFAAARSLLAPAGRMIEPVPTIPAMIGATLANRFRQQQHLMLITTARTADLADLAGRVASGALKVTIARCYPFSEAAAALAALDEGGILGKIVVTF